MLLLSIFHPPFSSFLDFTCFYHNLLVSLVWGSTVRAVVIPGRYCWTHSSGHDRFHSGGKQGKDQDTRKNHASNSSLLQGYSGSLHIHQHRYPERRLQRRKSTPQQPCNKPDYITVHHHHRQRRIPADRINPAEAAT